jgi:hypothetical protein
LAESQSPWVVRVGSAAAATPTGGIDASGCVNEFEVFLAGLALAGNDRGQFLPGCFKQA